MVNTVVGAIIKLEETSYYQESYIVKDYLDEFQILNLRD